VALLRPDLVASAALVAGYGRQNTIDRILQDAWQCLDDAGPDLDPVRLALLALTSHPPHALGDDAYLDPLVDGMRHWSAETDGPGDSRRRARAFIDSYRDRLPALAGIRVPCLVMGFELDADTFVVRAREVAAAIPASRYVELPSAGHLTPVTAPEQVAGPVVRFFDEVEAGPPGAAGNATSPRRGASP
jgi:pimeloyl-ACP methyl ester carboxylesterase